MNQKKKILWLVLCVLFLFVHKVKATENDEYIRTENVIQSQKNSLKITEFLEQAKEYQSSVIEDIDMDEIFSEAISGNISAKSWKTGMFKKVFKEFSKGWSSLGTILLVILLHGVLKAITDGLQNKSVSEISYFTSYILIITIIIKNLMEIMTLIKHSIENLVSFVNCLFPVLVTLLVASGGITSATALQPIILLGITILSNMMINVMIPISLIAIALGIISNVSHKISIEKLSHFFNSSIIWTLGILLTVFIGVIALEGTLGKRSRSSNSQNNKSCCFFNSSSSR